MSDTKELVSLEKYRKSNALVFVHDEDLRTQRMFLPVVTKIPVSASDFHDRAIQGKMMPRSHHVDRIGEAAGVEFLDNCGTRKEGENCYVGWAQGRRRMPDGTWRSSTVQQYEFDVDIRAEEDFLNDKSNRYSSDVAKRKHVLELKKVARQRASTGARLRVIRELVGIPIAFAKEDFQRAIVVSRIAVNTDAMLDDPDMRKAALAYAVGATEQIYGPQGERDVSPAQPLIGGPEEEEWPEFNPDEAGGEDPPEDNPIEAPDLIAIAEYIESYNLPPTAIEEIEKLDNTDEVAVKTLLHRIKKWCDNPKNEGARK